jgi:hypothetical protein
MRTVPNMYTLNLAISDIIFLTVLFSETCENRISNKRPYGDFMCRFLSFCRRMSVGLSAYSVAAFSFQRYRVQLIPSKSLSLHRQSGVLLWLQFLECGLWLYYSPFHQLYLSICVTDISFQLMHPTTNLWLFFNYLYPV